MRAYQGFIVAFLIAVFCALTGPGGETIYVAPGNVSAVFHEPGVGAAPTVVVTGNGNFYVKESVSTVIARLRGSAEAEKPIGHDN